MSKFHDIRSLLERVDQPGVRKQLDAKSRTVKLDKLADDGRKLLHLMCGDGKLEAVRYLLEKGANPNAVSTWGAIHGPPLLDAVRCHHVAMKFPLEIVRALLAAGADVDAKLAVDKQVRGLENGFKGGTLFDFVVADALHYQKEAKRKGYDADSSRYMKRMAQQYLEVIPLLRDAGASVSPAATTGLAKLGLAGRPAAKAKPLDAKWIAKARAKLKKGTRTAADVCEAFLSHPDAVAHAEWPALVEEVIGLSKTFEDVAEDVYGERVSFVDDEGWLAQGWDNYVILDVVLELLGKEATLANKQWEKLVRRVFELRPTYYAVNYVPVDEFFAQPWVRKHPSYKQLVAFERATRRTKGRR